MLFKVISDGYILGVGIGSQGTEITQEEYDQITELMHNKPSDTEDTVYKLSESFEWVACERDNGLSDEVSSEEIAQVISEVLG